MSENETEEPTAVAEMYEAPEKDDGVTDTFESAVQMSFIGTGQGGGRIAEAFYDFGYRRVCVVNTTEQDLSSLSVKNKLVIGNNRGGAGKDPEQGMMAAKESTEDIMDLLMKSWGPKTEQMFICVGAGGGSGSGSWQFLVEAAKEYAAATNIEKPLEKRLGVIMTLPKRSEGARVQANACSALTMAIKMLEGGEISSLIIVDNARIHELFPRLSVKKFWRTANRNFASVLHTFNQLSSMNSEYNTFDRADFRSVLRNGMLVFGMTRVEEWDTQDKISKAVRQNLKGTLLAEGFDLKTGTIAGAIVEAEDAVLEEIPMEDIDYVFYSLGRTLGNDDVVLHSGIYEGEEGIGIRVYTIISGLAAPEERLAELRKHVV
jgi:cell division GTPase FtsZ